MRSSIAKAVAVALGLAIVLCSAGFAIRQNPGPREGSVVTPSPLPVPPTVVDEAEAEQGRRLFLEIGCARCHSVQGQGNSRYPLDGVGARRAPSDLRAWMLAVGPVEDSLSRSVVRAKQRFRDEPEEALASLEVFLTSLRGDR
jgi:hypothetical protein